MTEGKLDLKAIKRRYSSPDYVELDNAQDDVNALIAEVERQREEIALLRQKLAHVAIDEMVEDMRRDARGEC